MNREWYYTTGGAQQGPVGEEQLKQMIAARSLEAGAMVWCQGMAEWKAYETVPELIGGGSSAAASGAPVANPLATSGGVQPYQAPGSNPAQGVTPYQRVPNYLWQSIVCTLLCCLPFGIVAIVYAAKVDGLMQVGNVPAAMEASGKAKTWCWVSFGLGLAVAVLYFMLGIASATV